MVFQEIALFPWMTTLDNVMFGPRAAASRRGARAGRVPAGKFGVAQFRDKYPEQLSGGMQRRAELARA